MEKRRLNQSTGKAGRPVEAGSGWPGSATELLYRAGWSLLSLDLTGMRAVERGWLGRAVGVSDMEVTLRNKTGNRSSRVSSCLGGSFAHEGT